MWSEIIRAIRALGERRRDIRICDRGEVAAVYVAGSYFGVYDYARRTFID